MDEILDYYDDSGKKIGKEYFSVIHRKGLLHKVVTALIFKDKTKRTLLIQKRGKNVILPGKWTNSAGGHVKSGQTNRAAMIEEIQEELFSKRKVRVEPRFLKRFRNIRDIKGNNEIVYLYELVLDKRFYFDKEEVADLKWVDIDCLKKDMKRKPSRYTKFFINLVETSI